MSIPLVGYENLFVTPDLVALTGIRHQSSPYKLVIKMSASQSNGISNGWSKTIIISVGYRINSLRATKFRIWSTSIIKEYMRRGYVVNRNAISEQKFEDLKNAVGLLENVFSKELLLTSDQAIDLFHRETNLHFFKRISDKFPH